MDSGLAGFAAKLAQAAYTCLRCPRPGMTSENLREWYYSAMVRTTLEVGRASPPPGPFVSLRISSS
jgi:hypothetical protein